MRSFFITSLVVLLLPTLASAQMFGDLGGTGGTPGFSLSADPQYPAPNSQVTISTLSSTLDLTNAVMTVMVGSKEIYKGNTRPVAVPVGKTGTITSVTVLITSGGAKYSQKISIQPQDVVVVAEPVSSAPVWYAGKPLVPLEGDVRVVAMANLRNASGKMSDPAALSYSWTVDGAQVASASGIGKRAIIVASPLQYRSRSVSVAVMSQDGTLVGGASLSLIAEEPLVRIYRNDPLLGILYDHALSGDYAITEAEDAFYAAAFSMPKGNGAPLLQWFLDGTEAQTGNSITLRPTGNGTGSALLSLIASAGESTKAANDLSLSFGATTGGFNLFGL